VKIGELAAAADVSPSRIRFYETAGLLAPDERTGAGYRMYGEAAVKALQIIKQAQLAGFTLAEIKALLPAEGLGGWNRDAVLPALRRKLVAIEEMQRQLSQSERKVRAVIDDIEAKPADVTCEENADLIMAHLNSLLA
jgi:DNA-binding transcriptional MerR regulator